MTKDAKAPQIKAKCSAKNKHNKGSAVTALPALHVTATAKLSMKTNGERCKRESGRVSHDNFAGGRQWSLVVVVDCSYLFFYVFALV